MTKENASTKTSVELQKERILTIAYLIKKGAEISIDSAGRLTSLILTPYLRNEIYYAFKTTEEEKAEKAKQERMVRVISGFFKTHGVKKNGFLWIELVEGFEFDGRQGSFDFISLTTEGLGAIDSGLKGGSVEFINMWEEKRRQARKNKTHTDLFPLRSIAKILVYQNHIKRVLNCAEKWKKIDGKC